MTAPGQGAYPNPMHRDRLHFLLLNVGHFLDHLFMLIFAAVAALALSSDWRMGYGDLLKHATPGFFAFGLFSLPAGWLADKWSREGMMCVFFAGIGIASIAAGLTETPLQMGVALFVIGMFAAIYHPVGLAIVTAKWRNTGIRLAVNGVWGNLGVASAALITGYLIDNGSWRAAFVVPGAFSLAVGVAYLAARWPEIRTGKGPARVAAAASEVPLTPEYKRTLVRFSAIVFVTAAVSSIVFQSTTFALPKIFDERLKDLAGSATAVGSYAFLVFSLAAFAQLVVGYLVDRYSIRLVFAAVVGLQAIFFATMLNLTGVSALLVAFGFMLVVFGQIPINDVMVGRITRSEWRARMYAVRYIVTLSVAASAVPMIAGIHATWGFAALFMVMAGAASLIFVSVLMLPSTAAMAGRPAPQPAE